MKKKVVTIVEDDPGIREAYQIIINGSGDTKPRLPMEMLEALLKDIYKVLPDIVIMDVGLPGINGSGGYISN